MSDRPINFRAPMIRALLDGRKSQTRRVLKPQPGELDRPFCRADGSWHVTDSRGGHMSPMHVPYAVGDRLWVRERCRAEELSLPQSTRPATKTERERMRRTTVPVFDDLDGADGVRYLADDAWLKIQNNMAASDKWGELYHYRGRGKNGIGNNVPSIHMPRWASRLTLTVTNVRVERLQEISRGDAMAEGCPFPNMADGQNPREWFRDLWASIHGPEAWDANPWCVAISFDVKMGNIDAL